MGKGRDNVHAMYALWQRPSLESNQVIPEFGYESLAAFKFWQEDLLHSRVITPWACLRLSTIRRFAKSVRLVEDTEELLWSMALARVAYPSTVGLVQSLQV